MCVLLVVCDCISGVVLYLLLTVKPEVVDRRCYSVKAETCLFITGLGKKTWYTQVKSVVDPGPSLM